MRKIIYIFSFFLFFSYSQFSWSVGEVPVFRNITSGYENGRYWVILGNPTLVYGGIFGSRGTILVGGSNRGGLIGYVDKNTKKFYPFSFSSAATGGSTRSTVSLLLLFVHSINSKTYSRKTNVVGNPADHCYGFFVTITGGGYESLECSTAPEVPAKCNITNSEILLDHKTINQKDVDGSKVESSFNINCSSGGKVKFSFSGGGNSIPLGQGASTIKINDLSLNSNIDLKNGDNNMKISSVLNGVEPGTWQGSAVLIFQPQ